MKTEDVNPVPVKQASGEPVYIANQPTSHLGASARIYDVREAQDARDEVRYVPANDRLAELMRKEQLNQLAPGEYDELKALVVADKKVGIEAAESRR